MSSIVYRIDKKTGNKYAYESVSFRDPVTRKPKTKKTYLGRVDPDTNQLIPKAEKGKRNRSMSTRQRQQASMEAQQRIDSLNQQVKSLEDALSKMQAHKEASEQLIDAISNAISAYHNSISE